MRRPWKWTPKHLERADHISAVVEELRAYHPLTVRQIYYRLLASGYFMRDSWKYQSRKLGVLQPIGKPCKEVGKLLKWMRIDKKIGWDVLEDRTRSISRKRGYEDVDEYLNLEKQWILNGYERCLIQGQDRYVELWVEKDALGRIFVDIADQYCMRTVVCRGYQSVSFIAEFYERAAAAMTRGQEVVVLYFGDMDPSGCDMMDATVTTLEDEMGLAGVTFKRIALTQQQIIDYDLPTDPMAAKPSDKRFKKYVEKYGNVAVELDALHPRDLRKIAKDAIEAEIDLEFYDTQKQLEVRDQARIKTLQKQVLRVFETFSQG